MSSFLNNLEQNSDYRLLKITIESLDVVYGGKLEKSADPQIILKFGDYECKSKPIDDNNNPVFNESFSFLIKREQLIQCGIIPPGEEIEVPNFEQKNDIKNFLQIDLIEQDVLSNKLKGSRKIHINHFVQQGVEVKGIKVLQIYENQKENKELKQSKNALIKKKSTMTKSQDKEAAKKEIEAAVSEFVHKEYLKNLNENENNGYILEPFKETFKKAKAVGQIKIEFELCEIKLQDELSCKQGEKPQKTDDHRARTYGVLKVKVATAINLNLNKELKEKSDYELTTMLVNNIENLKALLGLKNQGTKPPIYDQNWVTVKKENDQANAQIFLEQNDQTGHLFEPWLVVMVRQKGKEILLGWFIQKLDNAHVLLGGGLETFFFHRFARASAASKDDLQTEIPLQDEMPGVVLQLQLLNSIFTQKAGKGVCTLLIRSWTSNKEVLPTSAKALIKIKNKEGKELKDEDVRIEKDGIQFNREMSIGASNIIKCNDSLTSLEFTIQQKSNVFMSFGSRDVTVATFTLYLAEIFGNSQMPAIVERYLQKDFVDKKNTGLIKISMQGLFEPTNSTDQEKAMWERNKKTLMKKKDDKAKVANRTKSLKKQETVVIEDPLNVATKNKKKFKANAPDYQGQELFTLPLKSTNINFQIKPDGVLVILLKSLQFKAELSETKNYFLLISTAKEVIKTRSFKVQADDKEIIIKGDVLKLTTSAQSTMLCFKLFDESMPNECVAKVDQDINSFLQDLKIYQMKDNAKVTMQGLTTKCSLPMSIMYRANEFTKNPNGLLTVNLDSAYQLMYRESEYRPYIEFILGNQRIFVDEELQLRRTKMNQESEYRKWYDQGVIKLETKNVYDTLQIKFYRMNKDKKREMLELIGSEIIELSALLLQHVDKATREIRERDKHMQENNPDAQNTINEELEYENSFTINMKRVFRFMSGEIKLKFDYQPRHVVKSKLRDAHRTSIVNKLKEQRINLKNKQEKAAVLRNRDATSIMESPTSMTAQKGAFCFINVDFMRLVNIDARRNIQLRHIMLQLSFGKHKLQTNTTVNIGLTKNKHIINEKMEIFLKDVTDQILQQGAATAIDDRFIFVKAYAINNRGESKTFKDVEQTQFESQKTLLGEASVSTAIFRQLLDTELKYQLEIPLNAISDRARYSSVEGNEDENAASDEVEEVDEFQNLADGLLSKMDQDLKRLQEQQNAGLHKKLLLVQLSCLSTQSRIVKNPMGILSFSDIRLLNLEKQFKPGSFELGKNTVRVEFECNSVLFQSGAATAWPAQSALSGEALDYHKEQICLYPRNNSSEEYFSEGRRYFMSNRRRKGTSLKFSWLEWDSQFNFFVNSPHNTIDVKLVLDTQQTSTGKSQSIVIGRQSIPVAELSMYLEDAQVGHENNFAVEFNYLNIADTAVQLLEQKPEVPDESHTYSYDQNIEEDEKDPLNLLNKHHNQKLLMCFNAVYNPEVIKGARDLKVLKQIGNRFILPQVVKYNDYINQGFETMMNKQKQAKKMLKENKKVVPKYDHTHIAVEITLKSFHQMVKSASEGKSNLNCFLVFEPQFSVHKYVIQNYLDGVETALQSTEQTTSLQALRETRDIQLANLLGEKTDELLINAPCIFPVEAQFSEVFSVSDFSSFLADKKLKCWMQATCTKAFVSLFVAKAEHVETLKKVRDLLKEQPLMDDNSVLAQKNKIAEAGEEQVKMYQQVVDFEDALAFDKKNQDGSNTVNQSKFSQVVQGGELSALTLDYSDQLLREHKTVANTHFEVKVETSEFIDCPAGDINLIVKSISTANTALFNEDMVLEVDLVSKVSSDKVLNFEESKSDKQSSQPFASYALKDKGDELNHIMLNHVVNLVTRHIEDRLELRIRNTKQDKIITQTHFDISSMQLSHDKTVSMVILSSGTQKRTSADLDDKKRSAQKARNYFRIEVDVHFRSKGSKDSGLSALEIAIQNYKLMTGKSKLTPMEIAILEMIIERQEIASKLTPSRLQMRKVFFFMRNLYKLEYRTLDNNQRVHFLVSPLTFLFQIFSGASLNVTYDHYKTLGLRKSVEQEFKKCKPLDGTTIEVLRKARKEAGAEEKQIDFKDGNVLELIFDSQGIDLEKFHVKQPNSPMKYAKLEFSVQVCQANKPTRYVYKRVFDERKLQSRQAILQNHTIQIENVGIASEIKICLNQVPKGEDSKARSTEKREVFRPLGPAASLYLSDFTAQLVKNRPIATSLSLCKTPLDVEFKLLQNQLTKQPNRVIEVAFHRFIRLDPDHDLVADNQDNLLAAQPKAMKLNAKLSKHGSSASADERAGSRASNKDPNNIKMLLVEQPCIINNREVTTVADLVRKDADERGGPASQENEIVKGSINDMIREQTRAEQKTALQKYNLYVDFETCEAFHGSHLSMNRVEINKYGKTIDKEINRFAINNTSASNKIHFKIFRDGSRAAERLRQYGIGSTNSAEMDDLEEAGLLAYASVSMCHFEHVVVNQPQSFLVPMTQFMNGDVDPQSLNYSIENLFVLFSINVTDKAFGELVLNLNEFRALPECKTIREMQYRVVVKPSAAKARTIKIGLDTASSKGTEKDPLAGVGKAPRVEPLFTYQSPRIPYEIGNIAQLAVARELVVSIQMKDIFSNKRLFMASTAKEVFEEHDQRIFIDFFGFDKLHTKMLIAQKEISLIELIQGCLAQDAEVAAAARRAKAKRERDEAAALQATIDSQKKQSGAFQEERVSGRSQALEEEQAQRLGDAQAEARRMKDHRTKLRKMAKAGATATEIQAAQEAFDAESELLLKQSLGLGETPDKENRDSVNHSRRESNASAASSQVNNPQTEESPVSEGFQNYLLDNVLETRDQDEKTDFAQGADRPQELVSYEGLQLIASMKWSFSFQKREQKTEAYYASLAEQQELERIRQKKEIANILSTLGKLRGDADLLTKNLNMLSLTLASESCHKMDGPVDPETHKLFSNIPKLLMAFRSIFIEFRDVELPVSATVSLMNCCTYMKIICKNAGDDHLNSFQKHFTKAGIFVFIAEMFEQYKEKSRLLSLKILNFITFIINDIQELFFQNLSGVRLDPFLEYASMNEYNKADTEILMTHCQFVSSVCYCLFEHQVNEETEGIVIADLKRISQNVLNGIQDLISGVVNSQYKADYEKVVALYSDVALRVIHLSIQKFTLVTREKSLTQLLSKLFQALFVMLVDSIASKLSVEFIDQLKKSLAYELNLILQLEIRRDLGLTAFDGAEVQSKLVKLLEVYDEHLTEKSKRLGKPIEEQEYQLDVSQYFTGIKPILSFFSSEAIMDALAENNVKTIQRILQNPSVSNSEDFILFLHQVVRADLANESEIEGEDEMARQVRIKKSRYGKLTNINRFSMSHVEWLDDALPKLAGLRQ